MVNRLKRGPGWIRLGAALLIFSALVLSCSQDSLFADISYEQKPKDPRIPGTPTNIVTAMEGANTYLCVTNIGAKKIYRYREKQWSSSLRAPKSPVVALASDGTDLYALCGGMMSSSLYKYGEDEDNPGNWKWTLIEPGDAAGYSLQYVYGTETMIFAGGRKDNSWEIFCTDGNSSLRSLNVNASRPLSGAAELSGVYYVAAGAGGIFMWDSSASVLVPSPQGNVTGMINTNGEIIAVTSGGSVLKLEGTQFISILSTGANFTGGMCVWKKYDETANAWIDSLILLGVSSGSKYSKGYREITLDSSGHPDSELRVPGSIDPSSVSSGNKNKYEASIARYSVNFMAQVPDDVENFPRDENGDIKNPGGWEPLIFASTVLNGMQSLRNGLWNAE